MVSPTPVRFPAPINDTLVDYAARAGKPKSTVVVQAVSEWLRMQAHPRVVFVTAATGERRAALTVGPQVWTVAEAWMQHDPEDRDPEVVAEAVDVPVPDVEAALSYWAAYRDEIDGLIERNRADADAAYEAWQQRQALNAV
ncbi:MAG: hypothetical protein ACRDQA_12870 [Nocardioidaceae bacterium]